MCFDPVEDKIKHADAWVKHSYADIADAKCNYLKYKQTYLDITEKCHSSYKPIVDGWVFMLTHAVMYRVFKRYAKYRTNFEARVRDMKEKGADVQSRQTILQELLPLVKKRESILTCKSFMGCLGEES